MKKLLTFCLLLLNVIPLLGYPRDDTNTGGGFGAAILSIAAILFFMWFFDEDRNK